MSMFIIHISQIMEIIILTNSSYLFLLAFPEIEKLPLGNGSTGKILYTCLYSQDRASQSDKTIKYIK